ncbi:ABC transporter permease [Cohnella lubricantis]|uniref:ABC transporter permease n=1 Tax=Cohnella lubricantis TaxID=2163172 RepID=A0A841T7V8_9BACL|nr:ABC transporter permease [Cohnella lubricantis]MBB6676065.1 ABC transporter permease [Cohnella lubricantis]MBP2118020.1 hypothetical protein [Cohnella lubricantis]
MIRLNGLYRLLNHEFSRWLRFIALLCAAAIIVPLLLLHSASSDSGELTAHPRYEDLYAASGCPILFLLLLTLLCAYFLITIYRGYWSGKSIYTYLTLPVRRESLYFSKLFVFIACLLLLLAAQLISIHLGYAIFEHQARSVYEGKLVMHNGLFLAFVRSDFFRLLLPFSFSRALSSFSILAVIAAGFYYGALCERCRRYEGFAAIAAAGYLLYRAVAYRLNEVNHYTSPTGLYASSLLMLALSGLFVWHSLWLIRRGAVA